MFRRDLMRALASCGSLALMHCTGPQGPLSHGERSLKRSGLHDLLASHLERGEVPGLVCLVSRHGEVETEALGTKSVEAPDPMRRDTIFRVTSMTKPVTATAAMVLVEERKLHLDDPVDPLLPELASRRVLRRIDAPLDDTVPAARAITLRDLLAFRMGFGIVWGAPDAIPIQRAASELELGAFGPPQPQVPPPPDEWMRRFGTLPLMHQPGERWMYNTGAEVLGVLIARAAGMPLDRFFRERIFEPLGMKDTGSTCRRRRSIGSRQRTSRKTRSSLTRAASCSAIPPWAGSGARRRRSRREARGSSPRSTTSMRSRACCSRGERPPGGAFCRRRRLRS
jgi:CubicO group peptidase (beta-lactamase class C family)